MVTLIRAAQASACATAFETGREAGGYSALLFELRTVVCGSRGLAAARWRPAARRARHDRAAELPPARIRRVRRHRVP